MNPTPQNDHCRDPFDDALDAVICGDATAREIAILNDTLRIDPNARIRYIRAMAFEGMLAREFPPAEGSALLPDRRRRWLMVGAIAASVILGVTFAWRSQQNPNMVLNAGDSSPDLEDGITHAVITTAENATGRFGGSALTNGLRLTQGLLELDHGLVEITFDTGAEITLEGPAGLLVESESKSRLTSGRASAYCPEQARGFVMLTPTSYIRDLGTAFSVEVRDGKETDLHVIEGEVEAVATGRNTTHRPKILRQREAVRMAAGSMLPISFRPEYPGDRNRPPAKNVTPAAHWSFDLWKANTTVDSTRGHLLTLLKNNKPTTPDTLDGPFGNALHFDGQRTFATSDYPGVGGSQARTVACWLRVQADDAPSGSGPVGIVAWGGGRQTDSWQLAWNNNGRQGTVGAPRVEFGDGYVVASTDLRDGQWHHLAVVYLAGQKADVATHVRIYVDGKLDSLTGRRQRMVDTDITSTDANPLTLGRYLGTTHNRRAFLFEGDIDEVSIFNGPLLPKQIVRLMKKNSLQPSKP